MNIVHGAKVRVNTNLNMRRKPDVKAERVCTVQAGVQVTALAPPANAWLWATVRGWEHEEYSDKVFSEADASASVQARNGGGLGWRSVEYVGYLSMAKDDWLTVEDGPA